MAHEFSHMLAELRKARGLSQRRVAGDLGISQALLSHYENGAREPGLDFVCRACRYFGVSADYILGLSDKPGEDREQNEAFAAVVSELRLLTERAESALRDTSPALPAGEE